MEVFVKSKLMAAILGLTMTIPAVVMAQNQYPDDQSQDQYSKPSPNVAIQDEQDAVDQGQADQPYDQPAQRSDQTYDSRSDRTDDPRYDQRPPSRTYDQRTYDQRSNSGGPADPS